MKKTIDDKVSKTQTAYNYVTLQLKVNFLRQTFPSWGTKNPSKLVRNRRQ